MCARDRWQLQRRLLSRQQTKSFLSHEPFIASVSMQICCVSDEKCVETEQKKKLWWKHQHRRQCLMAVTTTVMIPSIFFPRHFIIHFYSPCGTFRVHFYVCRFANIFVSQNPNRKDEWKMKTKSFLRSRVRMKFVRWSTKNKKKNGKNVQIS